MNCGQQFGQQMAFGNGFLLQAILACNSPCVDLQHYNSTPQTKISTVKSFDSTADMAQMVGVEPTRQSPVLKHFESSTSRYSSYISLFRFALKRLFSVLTLVFDILTYFVLYVARGCLGNIWATIVFRATLFGTTQGKLKICTEFEDLAIFQSKSFFFVWRFYREKHKFCC